MAFPPPPYSNITGTSAVIAKYNQQESIANADGNARPGQLIVDVTNNDIYIGNVNGNLELINTGGGGVHADPAGPVGSIQYNAGGNLFGGSSNLTITANGLVATGNIQGNTFKTGNIIPTQDNAYFLGNATNRWANIWVGPGTIYITDSNTSSNLTAELTVLNGVLQINGSNQLQVGQLKFVDNTIESTTPNIDIQIGLTSSAANLVLNRNTVSPANMYIDGLVYSATGFSGILALPNDNANGDPVATIIGGSDPGIVSSGGFGIESSTVKFRGNSGAQMWLDASQGNLIADANLILTSNYTGDPADFKSWTFDDTGNLTAPGSILVQDGNQNDVIELRTDGNIAFKGSATLSVGGGFFVSSVATSNGQGNIVTYESGQFKYGPQLKDYTGNIGANNITLTGILKAPQTTKASNATGTPGQICWDDNYIYVCTATNTWKRSPLTGGY